MDPSAEEIIALAEQLTQTAKGLASETHPPARKQQTACLVLQAKQLIWSVQDPHDALMDHIVNVRMRQSCRAMLKKVALLTTCSGLYDLSMPCSIEAWYL